MRSMVRLATVADAEEILAIYGPVVRDTAISFEWDVPPVTEIAARIRKTLDDGYPWLVYEEDGAVAGYAYGSRFRNRTAYDWTVEVSVYVRAECRGRGVGRRLYERLLGVLEELGFRTAIGVATAPNPGSEALHAALGFSQVGRLPKVGHKAGAWHDVVCWSKSLEPESLGSDDAPPTALRRVQDVLRADS